MKLGFEKGELLPEESQFDVEFFEKEDSLLKWWFSRTSSRECRGLKLMRIWAHPLAESRINKPRAQSPKSSDNVGIHDVF